VALILLAAGAALHGCGETDQRDALVLTFAYWGDYRDNQTWRAVCSEFEAMHPGVDIVSNWVPGDYPRKLQLLMIGGSAPDVIMMDDELVPIYAIRGYLEDLGPMMTRDAEEIRLDGIFPAGIESFTYRGVPWGLPWGGNVTVVFYNKDLFDRAQLPYPTKDWTWDTFRRYAKMLTQDLDGDGRTDQYGSNIELFFNVFEPFVWSWGGEILNKDYTRSAMHDWRAIEAARFIYDLKFEDQSMVSTGAMEGMLAEAQLLTGRVGMTVGGSYLIQSLDGVEGGMRWGVAHMPIGPYGHRYTRATFDGISLSAQATPEKKAMGWEFIKYVLSEPVQRRIGERRRGIPVNRSDAIRYYVRPDSEADELIVIEAMDYAKLTPITPYYLELRTVTQTIFDDLNLGKQTPEEAVPKFEGLINEVLAKELERWDTAAP